MGAPQRPDAEAFYRRYYAETNPNTPPAEQRPAAPTPEPPPPAPQDDAERLRLHRMAADLSEKVQGLETDRDNLLRLLGAVLYYGCGGTLTLREETWRDDYVITRGGLDPATLTRRWRAHPLMSETPTPGATVVRDQSAPYSD